MSSQEIKRKGTKQTKRLDLSKFENEEIRRLYQTKTREWASARLGEGVNWNQMNRGLMEFTEGGNIRKNPENERNKKTKGKCRES